MSCGIHVLSGTCLNVGICGAAVLGMVGWASPCFADATIIARTGQVASAGSPSELRRFLMNNSTVQLPPPLINDNGVVLFYASLQGPGTYSSTDDGLWMHTPLGRSKIMRQGDPAPGSESATYFWDAQSAHLSQDDEVFLRANLTGTGVLGGVNDLGVWRVSATGAERIARMGEAAPGTTPVGTYQALSPLIVSHGQGPAAVALPAEVCRNNCVSQTSGVWMPSSSNPLRIEQGAVAPGTSGAILSSFQSFDSSQGSMLYLGLLSGGDVQSVVVGGNTLSNATAVWRDSGIGQPQLLVRSMSPLTSDPNGPVIGAIHDGSRAPVQASNGDVLFSATRYTRSTGAYLGHGLFRRGAQTVPIAVAGDPIAGLTGITFSSVGTSNTSRTVWPASSDAVFVGVLAGSGVTTSNNQSILSSSSTGLHVLARGGSAAPGCSAGQTFMNSTLADSLRVTHSGVYAFAARLQGTGVNSSNARGIWSGRDGSVSLALRQGMAIGDYSLYEFMNVGRDFQVNDHGAIVVEADVVRIGDPWNSRYRAILGYTPEGGAQLVAIVGQPLQTEAGPTPTIMSFKLGTSGALNNAGNVAFSVKFNGTVEDEGVVIAQLRSDSTPPCRADYDNSGVLTVHDIYIFLTNWFRGDADYDNSGTTEVLDIFAFLSDWYAGCD